MKIRPFKNTDADELATLFRDTVRNVNLKDYSEEQVRAWAPDQFDNLKWKKSFENKIVFVAEDKGMIIGFGELETNGHIDRFYIHREYVSEGIGSKIYARIEHQAKDLNIKRLYLEASFTAKPFFLKFGFKTLREQTVNIRGVEMNNFVMEKLLSL